MNFSEFKRRLGAEPRSEDAAVQAARASNPGFEQAAQEAEAFEAKLEGALRLAPPEELLEGILSISSQPEEPERSRRAWMPFALAASLLVAVGAAGMAWQQSKRLQSVESYLADHYRHDGLMVLNDATTHANPSQVGEVMAALDAQVSGELSDMVRFIKFCPTPQGRGAHMVVLTESGPVTIIFMPDSEVEDRSTVTFDGNNAYLVGLSRGSAALIGTNAQNLFALDAIVRQSILPTSLDT